MQYVFLIYADEKTVNDLPADERRAFVAAHLAVHRSLTERGALRYAAPLADSPQARTVGPDGAVTDGPYAEAKEQVGSIYVVDCADAAEALAVARSFPAAPGHHVEFRPALEV
jgi:hypothetical protein